mmetsp:Transcript_4708/g.11720  ORF Transcript_4708/g.11720 Transcript_4708/m.11720 type:complete len:309 (+) Transcript_4708:951-1877(+)
MILVQDRHHQSHGEQGHGAQHGLFVKRAHTHQDGTLLEHVQRRGTARFDNKVVREPIIECAMADSRLARTLLLVEVGGDTVRTIAQRLDQRRGAATRIGVLAHALEKQVILVDTLERPHQKAAWRDLCLAKQSRVVQRARGQFVQTALRLRIASDHHLVDLHEGQRLVEGDQEAPLLAGLAAFQLHGAHHIRMQTGKLSDAIYVALRQRRALETERDRGLKHHLVDDFQLSFVQQLGVVDLRVDMTQSGGTLRSLLLLFFGTAGACTLGALIVKGLPRTRCVARDQLHLGHRFATVEHQSNRNVVCHL